MTGIEGFWAVIPAGGAGTRLWPLSRASSPKFLLDLTGSGRSLLQDTVHRLEPLAADRFLVVTGRAHEAAVSDQLPDLPPDATLAEPSGRDSMAAIGLAAAVLERRDPDAVMGSFAADHVITDPDAFRAAVRRAVDAARGDLLVTLGIEPTGPATAYGYIHVGDALADLAGVRRVVEFVEKPDAEGAAGYLATGRHRWNAGIFVVRPTVLLDLLAQWHPELAAGLRAIARDPASLDERWPTLPAIAIDHAVAEPAASAGRVAVVPVDCGWSDLGDFDALATLLERGDGRPAVLGDAGLVHAVDASGLVVPGQGRVVAVVGLDDVVVVDTPDALLVTSRARAQEVRQVVGGLRERGRTDLT